MADRTRPGHAKQRDPAALRAVAATVAQSVGASNAIVAFDRIAPSADPVEAAKLVKESRRREHSKTNVERKIAACREWLDAFERAWREAR